MANIHSTAIVSETAKIADSATIGAYAIIEDGVSVGEHTIIEPHAHLYEGAKIGNNCRICGFTTIAGLPQDLHFDVNTKTYVEIGDGTVVREGTTVHRATFEGKATVVGKDCLLMANAHIGHDCVLGDRVIFASFSAAAGHTHIGNDAFVSGGVMLHQKIHVGEGVMISGNSAIGMDVPPYVNAYKRNDMAGFNLVGMLRRKVPHSSIANLKALYQAVYAEGNPRKIAKELFDAGKATTPEGEIFLKFFFETETTRPILRPRGRAE